MKCSQSSLRQTVYNWFPALSFGLFFGTTGNLLIHEAGHVAATACVYKDLSAEIKITGLFKAATSWSATGLTPFGTYLGHLNARLFVCVAGPLTAILAGTVALIAVKILWKRYPELSKYLVTSAIMTVAYQVFYALSALWVSQADLGHDFVMLRAVGVHPIVSSAAFSLIPVLAMALYSRYQTGSCSKIFEDFLHSQILPTFYQLSTTLGNYWQQRKSS